MCSLCYSFGYENENVSMPWGFVFCFIYTKYEQQHPLAFFAGVTAFQQNGSLASLGITRHNVSRLDAVCLIATADA